MDESEALRLECISLINRIARSPYNLKLLLSARAGLQIVAGYKAHRSQQMRQRMQAKFGR
ncbi:hypothetical protein H6F87_28955 [Cyanobacteria bacterium FACHB-502]|nr:hypothetical protein [Cyanobacteria bacterium FACHB-502]